MCRSDLHNKAESMRKNVVYVGFIDLEKVYDRVNKEALWHVLRMCDVGGKLLSGMYVYSLACVRVKGGENDPCRIDSGVRQGCLMSLWLFNVYMDAVMKEVKMGMGRWGVRFLEERRKWRLPSLLYADDMVLYGELEEDMRAMVGRFAEVCRWRGLKVNAGKSKVMIVNVEEGLECEVYVDRICLEHVSAECSMKVARGGLQVPLGP